MKLIKLLIISLLLTTSTVFAASWPNKEVTIVVPFLPGGASDIVARKTALILGNRFPDTSFVVKYMPGASNMVAISYVLNEKNSDNIFVVGNDDLITGPLSQGHDSYNEFVVTNIIGYSPYMLAISTRQTPADFRNTIKNKGIVMFGSVGAGSGPATWLTSLQGPITEWKNIPYKGAPAAITDVIGGTLNYIVLSSFNMYDYVQDGRVTPIMISSDSRINKYPTVPTFRELGFRGHRDGIYFAVYAKKNTNPQVLREVNQAIYDAQKNGAYQEFEDKSMVITPYTLEQSNQFFQESIKQKQAFYKQ